MKKRLKIFIYLFICCPSYHICIRYFISIKKYTGSPKLKFVLQLNLNTLLFLFQEQFFSCLLNIPTYIPIIMLPQIIIQETSNHDSICIPHEKNCA